jgi:hypothetical protein
MHPSEISGAILLTPEQAMDPLLLSVGTIESLLEQKTTQRLVEQFVVLLRHAREAATGAKIKAQSGLAVTDTCPIGD